MPDFKVHRPLWIVGLASRSLCGVNASGAETAAAEDSGGPLQEITVTATRHEESLSKVPISVTAFTQEAMDLRGIKDFQDIARFTPGVNIDNSGTNNISIRGIASTGGAGTTGIYIDDTPIQIRGTAFNPDDALPKSFDINRIEVLRGPQGTLFGAGSEGGTVRYITTQPSLTQNSFYSREEVSFTQGGTIKLRRRHCGGRPLDRQHAGRARDRLVSARRRLHRSARSGLACHRAKECQLRSDRAVSAGIRLRPLGFVDDYAQHLLPGPVP